VTPASRAEGWRRLALLLVGVVALDQVVKAIVVGAIEPGDRVEVLPFLDLVHVMNEGVAFGFLGDGERGTVLAITGAALLFVLVWFMRDPARPWSWLAIGLLAGGAIGNLVDRLFRDAVVDYLDFPAWPAFNVADIAITVGAAILALSAFASEPGAEPEEGGSGKAPGVG
jgi:signal peptidase II